MWDTVWGAALPKKSFREKKAGKGGACGYLIFLLAITEALDLATKNEYTIDSAWAVSYFCGKERLYRRKKSICGSGANFPFLFPPSFLCWHFKRRLFLSLFHSSSFLRKMEFRNWSLRSKREDNDCADSPIRIFVFRKIVLPDPVRHRVSFLPSWRIRRRNLFSFFVVFYKDSAVSSLPPPHIALPQKKDFFIPLLRRFFCHGNYAGFLIFSLLLPPDQILDGKVWWGGVTTNTTISLLP